MSHDRPAGGPPRLARIRRLVSRAALPACLALVVALAAGAVPWPGHALPVAYADGGQASFGLRPVTYDPTDPVTKSYFVFDAQLGAVVQSQVLVTNEGTAAGTVRLYPVDATTGQTGGIVYRTDQDPRQDIGAWLTLDTQELTLDPGESRAVAFTLAIPPSAPPGQHVGGLVAEDETILSSSSGGAVRLNVKSLSIVAVQVNLPGPALDRLDVTSIRADVLAGSQRILIGLSDSGTTMLKPTGALDLLDAQGQTVRHLPLALDTLLPRTQIEYPAVVPGAPLAPGAYTARLSLTYGTAQQTLAYTAQMTISQDQASAPASDSHTAGAPTATPGHAVPTATLVLLALTGLLALGIILTVALLLIFGRRARRDHPRPAHAPRPPLGHSTAGPRPRHASHGAHAGADAAPADRRPARGQVGVNAKLDAAALAHSGARWRAAPEPPTPASRDGAARTTTNRLGLPDLDALPLG